MDLLWYFLNGQTSQRLRTLLKPCLIKDVLERTEHTMAWGSFRGGRHLAKNIFRIKLSMSVVFRILCMDKKMYNNYKPLLRLLKLVNIKTFFFVRCCSCPMNWVGYVISAATMRGLSCRAAFLKKHSDAISEDRVE